MGQHRIHLANIARLKRGGTAGGRTLGPGKEHPATRLPIQPMHGEQRSAEVRKHPPFERISTRAGSCNATFFPNHRHVGIEEPIPAAVVPRIHSLPGPSLPVPKPTAAKKNAHRSAPSSRIFEVGLPAP